MKLTKKERQKLTNVTDINARKSRVETGLDDLPEELKKQLTKSFLIGGNKSAITSEVQAVLTSTPQSIDEILIEAWRRTGHTLNRNSSQQALRDLVAKGFAAKAGRAHYVLGEKK